MARTAKQRAAQRKASLASARKRRKAAKLQKYGPRRGKRTAAQTRQRRKRTNRRVNAAAAGIVIAANVGPSAYIRHTATADKRRNSTRGRNKAAKRSMSSSQRRASRNRVKDQRYLNKHMTVTVGPARPIRQGAIAGRRIRTK